MIGPPTPANALFCRDVGGEEAGLGYRRTVVA